MLAKINFDVLALFTVLTIAVLSLVPENAVTGDIGKFDVVLHALAYALICACAVIRRRTVWSALLMFASVVLFGFLIEFIQPLFGRSLEFRDLVANIIGSTTGLAAALAYKSATDPDWKRRSTDVS